MTEITIGRAGTAKAIIIRFNLYLPQYRGMANITNDDYLNWCRHRADIFINFTLPSLLLNHESRISFTVIVYFDTELNEHVQAVLDRISGHAFIRAEFLDMRDKSLTHDLLERMSQDVLRHVSRRAPYIVTTRMDSDDVLAPNFVQNLRRELMRIPVAESADMPVAVSLPYGAQWDGTAFNVLLYEKNPFISFVEERPRRGERLHTVYSFKHHKVDLYAKLHRRFTDMPAWLQIIHDRNAANRFDASLAKLDSGQMLDWFRLNPNLTRN